MIGMAVALTACSGGDGGLSGAPNEWAADRPSAEASGSADDARQSAQAVYAGTAAASFTRGLARTTVPQLAECRGGRTAALGEIADGSGGKWIVPAPIDDSIPLAGDLANECTGQAYASIDKLDPDSLPIVEIDADGVLITGYIFADNYFELYVNGKPVARDAVPFTPFNSSFVRFKAKYPLTYAIKAVDWEENLGVGTEDNRGNAYYYGDGGIVAVFSDGTVTGADWLAQNYYTAPLADPADLVVAGRAGKAYRTAPAYSEPPACGADCYAAHFAVPDDWYAAEFDDSDWPAATTYAEKDIGVDNKRSYTAFADQFRKGEFVWTSSLTLDNLVLLRHTVDRPPS